MSDNNQLLIAGKGDIHYMLFVKVKKPLGNYVTKQKNTILITGEDSGIGFP